MPIVSGAELARIAGVSLPMVTKYKKAGVLKGAEVRLKKYKHVKYDQDIALELIKKNLDPNFTKDADNIKNAKTGDNGGKPNDFTSWRTIETQYKAASQKLDYDIKAGNYVLKTEVERLLFTIGRGLREDLLNIPARMAALCAAKSKKKEREIYQMLFREQERGLTECLKKLGKVIK